MTLHGPSPDAAPSNTSPAQPAAPATTPTPPTADSPHRHSPQKEKRSELRIVPVSLREAREFVETWHRHHRPPVGHKFSLGVADDQDRLVGVAITGRPVARMLDDGWTLEVTRVATDQTPNACSALYAATWRAARAMGNRRLLTYTQQGESGASLRAVGWQPVAVLPPRPGWQRTHRRRTDHGVDNTARVRWEVHAP